jgi:phytoene dehydrogenase-like protein
MTLRDRALDAVVVGSGPNGLAAAITLARAGLAVRVYEGAATAGGGLRSAELTLPGFVHDPCATVVATALVSPFFRTLDLPALGVELAHPEVAAAHLLAPDRAVLLHRSVEATAAGLGRDGAAWRRLFGPLARGAERLMPWILGPVPRPTRHVVPAARFGPVALLPAAGLARLAFREEPARALLGALAAHAMVPLESAGSAAFGLVLATAAHAVGWPVVVGGSQRLADALVGEIRRLGGEVITDAPVRSLADLPPSRAVLLDVTPRQLVELAGERAPAAYIRRLRRFRYGPGVSKVDWALDGPIPWQNPDLARAGTIHLGGTFGQLAAAERAVAAGRIPRRPFVILVQATVMDPTRAPAGRQTAWAYAHVPHGSDDDVVHLIEAEVERAAPGFRDLLLGRHTRTAAGHEAYNPNYVGGDIGGGLATLRQVVARPTLARDPYRTPLAGVYLCSSSTPPGGGVHGMSGHRAATSALHREFGIRDEAGRVPTPTG